MGMNPAMRMMMIDRIRQPQNNGSEYGGGNRRMIGFESNRNGQNDNRMEYGGGGYSNYGGNRMEYGMEETENRRRRDSRGRYMEGRGGAYNGGYDDGMPNMGGYGYDGPHGYSPHIMGGSSYGDIYAKGTIYAPNAMNRPGMMGMDQEWAKPVDEHTARKWVQKMDGGEKWKPEQIDQLRQAICPECEKWEFYVTMNAMYSDYCETAKKMGMDKPEFYAYLSKDFLKDKDAKPHKLRRYMEHIAK